LTDSYNFSEVLLKKSFSQNIVFSSAISFQLFRSVLEWITYLIAFFVFMQIIALLSYLRSYHIFSLKFIIHL
jgi:hypothetical protein